MLIELIARNGSDDGHWVILFKAKYFEKTMNYIASFESFTHAHLTSETFVGVRVWEAENVKKSIPKHLFLYDLERAKKKAGAKSVIELYAKWKGGEDVSV